MWSAAWLLYAATMTPIVNWVSQPPSPAAQRSNCCSTYAAVCAAGPAIYSSVCRSHSNDAALVAADITDDSMMQLIAARATGRRVRGREDKYDDVGMRERQLLRKSSRFFYTLLELGFLSLWSSSFFFFHSLLPSIPRGVLVALKGCLNLLITLLLGPARQGRYLPASRNAGNGHVMYYVLQVMLQTTWLLRCCADCDLLVLDLHLILETTNETKGYRSWKVSGWCVRYSVVSALSPRTPLGFIFDNPLHIIDACIVSVKPYKQTPASFRKHGIRLSLSLTPHSYIENLRIFRHTKTRPRTYKKKERGGRKKDKQWRKQESMLSLLQTKKQ